ncbi:carboxymuconolactone decarboxylase family protein [Actinoplanes friuliensis]|jgi:4-carboxymuconolactone decarboxylase|uniref:Carboxymuconolactone decarboxylase n=1 Tax=Actinoplanes friuliensis DSM 7358 TaxID=1246995 RepID=U5VWN3_9ACTN|nr:carboxymuconolactone decarboxylase family protein [Actinoplanes friuliensis]AGZ41284.1 carboxymuconolactone decarboxylase [Actinoplanes friuliensis DSM 7358]
MSARAEAGREVYARNFGVEPAEAERIMNERAGAVYTQEAFEAAGGPGWQGQNLTDRDRSIAVIAALVAQNVTDVRLSTYLALARRTGLDEQALTELMVLLTAYLGQPYTSLAMEAVRRSAVAGTPDRKET